MTSKYGHQKNIVNNDWTLLENISSIISNIYWQLRNNKLFISNYILFPSGNSYYIPRFI